jgi:hypothetical protein
MSTPSQCNAGLCADYSEQKTMASVNFTAAIDRDLLKPLGRIPKSIALFSRSSGAVDTVHGRPSILLDPANLVVDRAAADADLALFDGGAGADGARGCEAPSFLRASRQCLL